MNLSINNNPNNKPSFGMSLLIDESAHKIIKEQTSRMSKKAYQKFWNKINTVKENLAEMPENVIIRKADRRNVLAAEVVDSNADTAIKNYVTAQGLIHRNGSLRFLKRAENRALRLSASNENLKGFEEAEERHYFPGGRMEIGNSFDEV